MFFRYEEWNFLRKFNKKVLVKLILGHFQVKISEQGQNMANKNLMVLTETARERGN